MKVRAYLISMIGTKINGVVVWNSDHKLDDRWHFRSDHCGVFHVHLQELFVTDADGKERRFNPRHARGY